MIMKHKKLLASSKKASWTTAVVEPVSDLYLRRRCSDMGKGIHGTMLSKEPLQDWGDKLSPDRVI